MRCCSSCSQLRREHDEQESNHLQQLTVRTVHIQVDLKADLTAAVEEMSVVEEEEEELKGLLLKVTLTAQSLAES